MVQKYKDGELPEQREQLAAAIQQQLQENNNNSQWRTSFQLKSFQFKIKNKK